MRFWVFQILNGLTTGALLFFVASGLTVVFGLMRILNLAHGALFLFGGYVGLTVQEQTGNFALAVLAGGARWAMPCSRHSRARSFARHSIRCC
ncbi:MAG: hypothetical protein C4345_13995 [Chloroflexota bacterium]